MTELDEIKLAPDRTGSTKRIRAGQKRAATGGTHKWPKWKLQLKSWNAMGRRRKTP